MIAKHTYMWITRVYYLVSHELSRLLHLTLHETKANCADITIRCDVVFNSTFHHNLFLARNAHLLDVKVWPNYDLLYHKRGSRNTKIISFMDRKINRKLLNGKCQRQWIYICFYLLHLCFPYYNYFIVDLLDLVTCLIYFNSRYESRILMKSVATNVIGKLENNFSWLCCAKFKVILII